MTTLMPFLYEGNSVRIAIIDGDPWFVAADVCRELEIVNPTRALSGLDQDEIALHIMKGNGGDRELNIISESGLYALIFRSRKPAAVAFRKWVTAEVIPSIRKTGSYRAETGHVSVEPSITLDAQTYAQLRVAEALQQDAEARRASRQRRTKRDPFNRGNHAGLIAHLAAEGQTPARIAALCCEPLEYVQGVLDAVRVSEGHVDA